MEKIGRYVVERKLSEGGMAEVFLARVESVGGFSKKVVLKSVLPRHLEEPNYVKMLLNEARIAAGLDHPNLVQVLDLIEHEERFYIVMEYLEGQNLRLVLRQASLRKEKLAPGVACRIIADLLAGLAYAHTRTSDDGKPLGLVHRDVSPPNVIVSVQGGVKLIDFGIAKATEVAGEQLTRAGQFKGKCAYMSPEQVRCKGVDRRSDIFSTGILFWELLTGKRLFLRDGDHQSMMAVVKEPSPSPQTGCAELDAICLKALAIDPEQRWQSADEMRQEIEKLILDKNWAASAFAVQRHLEELFDSDSFDERPTHSLPSVNKDTVEQSAPIHTGTESGPVITIEPGTPEPSPPLEELVDPTIKTPMLLPIIEPPPPRPGRYRTAVLTLAGIALFLAGTLAAYAY
jgi:eukaryotic-like serine/threonine-protein kinase